MRVTLVLAIVTLVMLVIRQRASRHLTMVLRNNARRCRRNSTFRLPGSVVAGDVIKAHGLLYTVTPTRDIMTNQCDFEHHDIRLSLPAYNGNSLVSVGIATHEACHAYVDDRDSRLGWVSTYAKALSEGMVWEMLACVVASVILYMTGSSDTMVPVLGASVLTVSEIVYGMSECISESKASIASIVFLSTEYGMYGRWLRRVSSFLRDAFMTHLLTAVCRVLASVTVLSLTLAIVA